ncbi:hypothetical protein [Actinoplanes subglobosus]|uniref:Uncharacterized protein n=1 Tax=Actinoplanes subglobosus TaxID=1547892 RepID=A0ABV8JBY6_9ACTN
MSPDWDEDEYLQCLHDARRRYAWVMRRHAGLDATRAGIAAEKRYPFEASDDPYRGIAFHDEAWHRAMLDIHGNRYWISHPDLAEPPAEYRTIS